MIYNKQIRIYQHPEERINFPFWTSCCDNYHNERDDDVEYLDFHVVPINNLYQIICSESSCVYNRLKNELTTYIANRNLNIITTKYNISKDVKSIILRFVF